MKLAGAAAGASFVGGSLVDTASAATGDHDGVQVDLVTGFSPNQDLGSTTYSSEGRLVNWEWGERYGNTGEDENKEPKSDTLDVTTDNGIEFDFGTNTATVNYNLSGSGGDQDLLLVSYDSPISDSSNPGWDPTTASDQEIYDYAHVSTQSDGSLTVDIPAADVPTSVTNHWRVNEGSGLTLGDAVGSLDATASSPTNLSWNTEAGLDGAHLQSSADTASGADLGSDSKTALSHFLAGDGAIGAWVYLESGELSSRRAIFSSGSNADDHVYLGTAGNGSELNFSVSANCCSFAVDLNFGSSAFTEGTWHSVVVTAERNGTDDADVTAYIDGTQVATTTYGATNSSANLTNSAQIGTDPGVSNTTWVGRLDDVWVSDQAGSAGDVATWHDATQNNYPPAISNLQAYYSLDGSTATNAITGTDATVTGSPTTGEPGIDGDAFGFSMNGTTSDRAGSVEDALTSGTDLPVNGSQCTVAGWFRFEEHEPFARIFQVGGGLDSAPTNGWNLEFDNQNNSFTVANRNDGNFNPTGIQQSLAPGKWYFIVTVIDGDSARLHVFDRSGQLDSSPKTGSSTRGQTGTNPLHLMAGDNGDINGRLDETYAYDTALSENQVRDLYLTASPLENAVTPTGSLEAYYPLDESSPPPTNRVNGQAASVTGTPSTGVYGIEGDAFEFTNDGSRDTTADALTSGTNLSLDGTGAAVAAWFRYTGKESYARVFQVGGDVGNPSQGHEVIFNSGSDELFVSGISSSTGTIPVRPNEWYLVVSVADGSDMRLHVYDRNGELPDSPATGSRSASNTDYPLVMMSGDDSEPAGNLDEVYAYSRALSTHEVDRLFKSTVNRPENIGVSVPYGLNLGANTEDRVNIDGVTFVNNPAPGVSETFGFSKSTGDSIDTSNVDNSSETLYQSNVQGPEIIIGATVLNGTYDVTIHISELFYTDSTGDRKQDVFVQGTKVASDLDVFDEVGHDAGYSLDVTNVDVKNGRLTVRTTAVGSDPNALLSGIEIKRS
jgi:hypothetical protein